MKRSQINQSIAQAIDFFRANHFPLPQFASWTPDTWRSKSSEVDEIRRYRLGWDVTDFHSGDFPSCGLTLFTLRNHSLSQSFHGYAEKIMLVRDHQLTPLHCHHRKTEDIINRGTSSTGDLVIQLYQSTETGELADTPVVVLCDGVMRHTEPGGMITLRPGESITLPPRLYHAFHAINGDALIGEVSSLNDDAHDNYFYRKTSRFPELIEDEPPIRLLCTEYPQSPEETSPAS